MGHSSVICTSLEKAREILNTATSDFGYSRVNANDNQHHFACIEVIQADTVQKYMVPGPEYQQCWYEWTNKKYIPCESPWPDYRHTINMAVGSRDDW
jgi:hypothetical protein